MEPAVSQAVSYAGGARVTSSADVIPPHDVITRSLRHGCGGFPDGQQQQQRETSVYCYLGGPQPPNPSDVQYDLHQVHSVKRFIIACDRRCVASVSLCVRMRVCLSVCLCVHALKGERLELSTPSLVVVSKLMIDRHDDTLA